MELTTGSIAVEADRLGEKSPDVRPFFFSYVAHLEHGKDWNYENYQHSA